MVKNALGLIETVGLAAGIQAADAAVKAANVELIGYELSKGGGMVVIKLTGDVGAVKAAVDAGSAAAAKINKVVAKHVIPRPHTELQPIVITQETVGYTPVQPVPTANLSVQDIAAAEPESSFPPTGEAAEDNNESMQIDAPQQSAAVPAQTPEQAAVMPAVPSATEVCNLCGDPACARKKGDPRITCIHYDKNNKEDE